MDYTGLIPAFAEQGAGEKTTIEVMEHTVIYAEDWPPTVVVNGVTLEEVTLYKDVDTCQTYGAVYSPINDTLYIIKRVNRE